MVSFLLMYLTRCTCKILCRQGCAQLSSRHDAATRERLKWWISSPNGLNKSYRKPCFLLTLTFTFSALVRVALRSFALTHVTRFFLPKPSPSFYFACFPSNLFGWMFGRRTNHFKGPALGQGLKVQVARLIQKDEKRALCIDVPQGSPNYQAKDVTSGAFRARRLRCLQCPSGLA